MVILYFRFFNPVLFASEGAVVAGQIGIKLKVLNSIFSLAFSWISTKVQIFSKLIAQKDYKQLDSLLNKTLMQSVVLNTFGIIVFFGLIFIFRYFNTKIARKNYAR